MRWALGLIAITLVSSASAARQLTIEEYVNLVLQQGEDAITAFNDFKNVRNSFKNTFRNLNLPQADVGVNLRKSKTDTDGSLSRSERSDGTLSIRQPLYLSGGNVSASMTQSTDRTDSNGSISRSKGRPSYSATLSQPLHVFKRNSTWRSWKRAKQQFERDKESYKRTLQTIRNTARQNYFSVVLNREQMLVEQRKIKGSERSYNITKLLVKAGRKPGIERARAENSLKNDRRQLKNVETEFQQSVNDALVEASLPLNEEYEFVSELTYEPLDIELDRLLEFAFQNRPDYKSALNTLRLSEIDVLEAKEANNPTLTANGTLSRSVSEASADRTTARSWNTGLALSWPFFDSSITKLNIKNAKNNYENAKIDFEGQKRRIEAEVRNAFLGVKRAEEQIEDLKQSIEDARRSVRIVRIRYKNGAATLTDLFDEENKLRDRENEYLQTLISANNDKDTLALQIGGLLDEVRR